MAAPIVTPIDTTVFLNSFVAVTDLFTAIDPDGDAFTMLEVFDFNDDATSGHFRLGNNNLGNGDVTRIAWEDRHLLRYVGGSAIDMEGVRIRVNDGTSWSAITSVAHLYTVRDNDTKPIVAGADFTLLANEKLKLSNIFTATDPDGHPITRYFVRDRNDDFSFMRLGTQIVDQATYAYYTPEEFDDLYYFGLGGGFERLDVFAYDGAKWSNLRSVVGDIIRNSNRPAVDYVETIAPTTFEIPLGALVNGTDADGNTFKFFEVYNTSDHSFAGDMEFRGNALAPKQWHRFNFSDRFDLTFIGAERNMQQQIRYRVSDGRYWSNADTIAVANVDRPIIGGDHNVISIHFQEFPIDSFYPSVDDGPSVIGYEIVDGNPNPLSGILRRNGLELDSDRIYSFSPSQFRNQLTFRSGVFETRSLDDVYVRADNGTFKSQWKRVTFRTEPELFEALDIRTGPWSNYLNEVSQPLRLTFSFMETPAFTEGEAQDGLFIPFTAPQRVATRRGFRDLEKIINVNFDEVSDSSVNQLFQQGGILRLGNYFNPDGEAAAYAMPPGIDEDNLGPNGDMWFNAAFMSITDWNKGDPAFTIFMHELGHALGMKHPFDASAPPRVLPPATEFHTYTVMSYTERLDGVSPGRFQLYDIYMLQELYGANMDHAVGDNLYDIAEYWGGEQRFVEPIWDGGGTDTLSSEGSIIDSIVDLRAGSLSSIGNAFDNVAIAFGVEIENALGSVNNDTLIGNHLDNDIRGNFGEDHIRGLGGNDFISGGRGNDIIEWGIGDGSDTINELGGAGRDTVLIPTFPEVDGLEDLKFRLNGRDLIINLNVNGGEFSEGSLRIVNQIWGTYRMDTLEIGSTRIDLVNLTNQASGIDTEFRVGVGSTVRGDLVVPV
ncbi:MAG: M10 family metallopeptidase [Planctomycetota bacterium]